MIWADRIALVLVTMLTVIYALSWPIGQNPTITPPQAYMIVGLVPWLLMRALDFIVTGRIRVPERHRHLGGVAPLPPSWGQSSPFGSARRYPDSNRQRVQVIPPSHGA